MAVVDPAQVVDVAQQHRQRLPEPLRAGELAPRGLVDAARVEHSRLVIGERLLAERRQRERPLDQHERQRHDDRERPRIEEHEADADADRRDDAVLDQAVHREEPARQEVVAARQPEHPGEQRVVDEHEA